jgi:hypothetical protein
MGCELFCGSTNERNQETYRRYVTAFLDAYVTCNRASFSIVDPHAAAIDGVEIFTSDNRGSPADVCPK